MAWHDQATQALADSGVDVVAHIPDAVLDPLVTDVETEERFETVRVAREEEAVGVLSGAWLGGRRGALVCQTSGLANTFNALGSLSKPWGLPFLGIVSQRGDLSEYNLAQVPAGYGTPRMLDSLGIRNRRIDGGDDIEQTVRMAARTAFDTEEPYVLLVGTAVTGGKR